MGKMLNLLGSHHRGNLRLLCLVWIAVGTAASNLHAPPAHNRRPLPRGGANLEPVAKLRKFAETDRMPSLFSEEEETYDRYAACLAATEGLRRLRDRDIVEEVQGIRDPDEAAQKRRQIAAQYVQNSGKVLRALGMSVTKFNELGKEINQDLKLKEKVRQRWPIKEASVHRKREQALRVSCTRYFL